MQPPPPRTHRVAPRLVETVRGRGSRPKEARSTMSLSDSPTPRPVRPPLTVTQDALDKIAAVSKGSGHNRAALIGVYAQIVVLAAQHTPDVPLSELRLVGTVGALASRMGVSPRSVQRHMAVLASAGVLIREQPPNEVVPVDLERLRASRRRRYQEQREARLLAAQRYYRAHKDRIRERELARPGRKERARQKARVRYERLRSEELAAQGLTLAQWRALRAAELTARRASGGWATARQRLTAGIRINYRAIVARDGLRCGICGGAVEKKDIHFDHVIPLSKGGAHAEWNIRVTHASCNRHKHARVPQGQLRFFV